MAEGLAKSYSCPQCKKRHQFPVYVFAHWDDRLNHECECGAKNVLFQGRCMESEPKKGDAA